MHKILPIVLFFVFSVPLRERLIKEDILTYPIQIQYLEGEEFFRAGLTGKGLRIAVLDGGFPGVDSHPALKHLIDRNQIIATWNFVKNEENVFTGVNHGTAVLGCIAGISDGKMLGLAPDAEYLLALTEKSGEPFSEELNWAKAVDWAIDHGANIIQSSLGYSYQRYFTSDLDGRHSVAAQAAIRAVRKGIIIVNCNGNEGLSRWKTVVTPADADSILSIGAINPETGLVAGYSSIGPTADNRMKPNVCAPGKVTTINPKGGLRTMEGTSFSSPLITGFAACTWQLFPNLTAQEIISLIEKSGSLYPYYDYSHGYGIPKASRILNRLIEPGLKSIGISVDEDNFNVFIYDHQPTKAAIVTDDYLYYHISNPDGLIKKYGVYRLDGMKQISISKSGYLPGDIFRCSHNGEMEIWKEK